MPFMPAAPTWKRARISIVRISVVVIMMFNLHKLDIMVVAVVIIIIIIIIVVVMIIVMIAAMFVPIMLLIFTSDRSAYCSAYHCIFASAIMISNGCANGGSHGCTHYGIGAGPEMLSGSMFLKAINVSSVSPFQKRSDFLFLKKLSNHL